MNHRVAVRTNGNQIAFGINFIIRDNGAQWFQMMHVNEVPARFSIADGKIKPTGRTFAAMMCDMGRQGGAMRCKP